MTGEVAGLPFELVARPNGTWRGHWAVEKVSIAVAGDDEAPAAALVDSLRAVVERWDDVKAAIAAFVRGLDGGDHVPLQPASRGGFAARSCGFEQPLAFEAIKALWPDVPGRVEASFYTGYPDGYATYAVVLDGGVPVALSAFAS